MVRFRSPAGALAALALAFCMVPVSSFAQDSCNGPADAKNIDYIPARFRQRIVQGKPIKIVAIGSSSTYGSGASSPAASYPSRLEAELKAKLPGLPVTVLNKGVGGEEAAQMVARFPADVLDEKPDLVLWQVGSNSVLRDHPTPALLIRQGIETLKAQGAEVVLINPQFAPKIIVKTNVERALEIITATARDEEVGLFNRFGLMRYWRETAKLPFERFITPDGVHMNDWGYACVATILADALLDGLKLSPAVASGAAATASLKR
jgi:lysophospholipase L1-like esterase